jgi:ComF family protein
MNLFQTVEDLLWLVYPRLCAACDTPLHTGEECICTFCRFHLPRTGFHRVKDNIVEKRFWGRVPFVAATSFFHFSKGEKVQRLIHRLKYNDVREIGISTGVWMGEELKEEPAFAGADLIVPVPLHARRLHERGYNQSALLAEGLSKSLGKPFSEAMMRVRATSTQTRKHRYERFENVDRMFAVIDPLSLNNKHILLVDDVITTGSTLIACAECLLEIPGTKISIATMAYA